MQSNLNITSIPSASSISSKPSDEGEADEKVKRKGKGGKERKGDREEKDREGGSIEVPKLTPISSSAPPVLWTATPPPHHPWGDLPCCLLITANTPPTPLLISAVMPQVLTISFPVKVGPSGAIQPWIPTPLANLSLVRKVAKESGPNLPYLKQVL